MLSPGARTSRLEQVTGHDEPHNLSAIQQVAKLFERFLERMCWHTVTRRAPSPLVAQMDIRDHDGLLGKMDRRSLGREQPPLEFVQNGIPESRFHRAGSPAQPTSRSCRRRSAAAADSN